MLVLDLAELFLVKEADVTFGKCSFSLGLCLLPPGMLRQLPYLLQV